MTRLRQFGLVIALLSLTCACSAQGTNGGILYASDFAKWTLPAGNTPARGTILWPNGEICKVSAAGYNFVGPKVGRPITIADANPAMTETVTPTAVSISSQNCQVSAIMSHTHSTYQVQSGTAGLQEALDYQAAFSNGALIVLTPAWTAAGGTTGMITSAQGNTGASIIDQRTSVWVSYTWNGSAYVASTYATVAGGATPGNCAQIGNNGTINAAGGPCGTGAINPGQLALAQYPTSTASSVAPANFTYDAATGNNLTIPGASLPQTSRPLIYPVADVTNPAYGAVANGIHDDAPALQAAKNALASQGGGTIFLPYTGTGTYYLNTTDTDGSSFLDITTDNIHVVCAPGVTLTSTSTTATMFRLGQIVGYGVQEYTVAGIGSPPKFAYQANIIANPGSPTITLTNPSNTSNFAVGDPIYILGGPGTESNGDGEINWITAIDPIGGVLTLRKPTAKPYTGNLSNVGTPNIVTVADGAGAFRQNLSVEGCNATPAADFGYIGQVIGAKLLNNYVVVNPAATRGMLANSFYPMADIEIAGNSYTEANIFAIQLADGWRDIYIHDNDFTSPYGAQLLDVSQGVINTTIDHNTLYEVIPSSYGSSNTAPIIFGTAYRVSVNDNIISLANMSAANGASAIATGLSNGVCHDCTFSNNIISTTSVTSNLGGGITLFGSGAVVIGNKITINNARWGISTTSRNNVAGVNGDYTNTIINNNKITMLNTTSLGEGIIAGGTTSDIPYQGQVEVDNNYIDFRPGALGTGIFYVAAGGGDLSHNYIYGAPTAFNLTSGTSIGSPQMVGNACANVTTTTGCQVLPDLGAQKFTGAITMGTLATPALNNPVAKTSGGTLSDSTQYCYQVQARNASGYSAVPTEKCVTTGVSGGINAVMVSWSAVPGATTYALYGRTTGAEAHMSPDGNFTNTFFLDTGSVTPSGATQTPMTNAPIILGSGNADIYSAVSGVVKTDGTFDATTTVNSKNICLSDGTNCPGSPVNSCSFLNGCIEQLQPQGAGGFLGIGGNLAVTGSCTQTNIAATSTNPFMQQCTGVTTTWSAGWVAQSTAARYYASRQPLQKFLVGYSASSDYTTNARIQLGLLASGCATATMIASDTPVCTYAIIRYSTVAGDTAYQCVTDTGSGSPNVVPITGATPTTTATAMSISFGASSVTCTVGGISATSSTKIPTGAMFDFLADSGTSSNATHLQLGGLFGVSQNGTF